MEGSAASGGCDHKHDADSKGHSGNDADCEGHKHPHDANYPPGHHHHPQIAVCPPVPGGHNDPQIAVCPPAPSE